MDAAKALALASLVALLATGFMPVTSADIGSPYVPDVMYDAATHQITEGSTIFYDDTRNIGVTDLPSTSSVLYICDSALAMYKSSVVNQQNREVDFTSVTFTNAGTWTVRDACSTNGTTYATFPVTARNWYEVDVAFPQHYSTPISWSGQSEYMTINVIDLMNARAPVPNADVVLYAGTAAERLVHTDANGFWDTREPLPGAGTFTVTASKNLAGDASYEVYGTTTFQVLASPLETARIGDPPLANYSTPVLFYVTQNTTSGPLLTTPAVSNYTLTLTRPDGTHAYLSGVGAAQNGPLAVLPNGTVQVSTLWQPGPYFLTLNVSATHTITGGPEWTQTWSVAADAASHHDLAVVATPRDIVAGQWTDITTTVTQNSMPYAADLYLLTTSEANGVQSGTFSLSQVPSSRFIPASQARSPGVYVFHVELPLAEGPFEILAREPGTPRHDDAAHMPVVAVEPAEVTFSPTYLAYGLQHNVDVSVHVTDLFGHPLDGTLMVNRDLSTGNLAPNGTDVIVGIQNGQGSFVASPVAKGTALFDFVAADSTLGPQRSTGEMYVDRPNITIAPAAVRLGQETPVSITVDDLSGSPISGLTVQLCGTPLAGCAPSALTDATGTAVIDIAPIVAGTLTVNVNGVNTGETVAASSSVNPNIILGEPSLETSRVLQGNSFAVVVPVTNTGSAAGIATLVLEVNGVQVSQQTVQVPAGQTENVQLTSSVDKVGTYSVSVVSGSTSRGNIPVTVLANEAPSAPSIPALGIPLIVGGGLAAALVVRRRR
ncbi:MAG: hypothetical protein ACYDDF_06225 [Thermoplasmatota archaeon]